MANEANQVAGLELADLPELGVDDGGGADEAAEARAIGAEDDGHVAGEIHRADGVSVVVDVGGVQAGLAAVACAPTPASGRSGGRRCGRNCSGPSNRVEKNSIDVVGSEKIGRAVRAVQHADLPVDGRTREIPASSVREREWVRAARCSTSPARRTRPAWPPNLPEDECAAAAEILGHIEAAGDAPGRRGLPRPRDGAHSSSRSPAS